MAIEHGPRAHYMPHAHSGWPNWPRSENRTPQMATVSHFLDDQAFSARHPSRWEKDVGQESIGPSSNHMRV